MDNSCPTPSGINRKVWQTEGWETDVEKLWWASRETAPKSALSYTLATYRLNLRAGRRAAAGQGKASWFSASINPSPVPLPAFPSCCSQPTATGQGKEGLRCTRVSFRTVMPVQVQSSACPLRDHSVLLFLSFLPPAPIPVCRTHPVFLGIREPYFSAHCLVFANNPFQAYHSRYSTRWHKYWGLEHVNSILFGLWRLSARISSRGYKNSFPVPLL